MYPWPTVLPYRVKKRIRLTVRRLECFWKSEYHKRVVELLKDF